MSGDLDELEAVPVSTDALLHPLTGELLEDDTDLLWEQYEESAEMIRRLYDFKARLAVRLAAKTTGEAKTRFINRHDQPRIKVEFPSDSFRQDIVREAWNAYPQFREPYLRIATLAVNLVEYKKLINEAGTPDFMMFRKILMDANQGPKGLPRISLEQQP